MKMEIVWKSGAGKRCWDIVAGKSWRSDTEPCPSLSQSTADLSTVILSGLNTPPSLRGSWTSPWVRMISSVFLSDMVLL